MTAMNNFCRASGCLQILLLLLLLSGCKKAILHKLDELEANRVLVVLIDAGIVVDKKQEGNQWNVVVESSSVAKALKVLEESRILKHDLVRVQSAQSSLIQSREEREHFLERQLSLGLEQTLEAVAGVLEARVHLHKMPTDEFRNKAKKQDSASVLILSSSTVKINEDQIRNIVSGASGIGSQFITVVISSKSNEVQKDLLSADRLHENKSNYVDTFTANIKGLNAKLQQGYRIFFTVCVISVGVFGFVFLKRKTRAKKVKQENLNQNESLTDKKQSAEKVENSLDTNNGFNNCFFDSSVNGHFDDATKVMKEVFPI